MKRKLPHFRFPGFKILDRYILGKFLSTYFFAIAMIIVVVVIFDYVEKIDNFTETKAPLKAIIFDYYLNFIPFFINQFSGLFTFIAVIFFTSKMAYQTEIVAMLSGGMSFRRLMWPYFLGALIIASLSLGLNLWLIPVSQRSCVAFENQYIPRKARFQYDKNIYRQIEPGTFAYIRNYSKESNQASFFSLEEYESGLIKTMNIVELNQFLEQQRSKGSDSINIIQVEQHARYAYPVGTFILTLIGVSLSSRKVRGGTGLHIGIGIALCFSYILFIRFFEEFAKSGTLPPWIAVWIPNYRPQGPLRRADRPCRSPRALARSSALAVGRIGRPAQGARERRQGLFQPQFPHRTHEPVRVQL